MMVLEICGGEQRWRDEVVKQCENALCQQASVAFSLSAAPRSVTSFLSGSLWVSFNLCWLVISKVSWSQKK